MLFYAPSNSENREFDFWTLCGERKKKKTQQQQKSNRSFDFCIRLIRGCKGAKDV